MALVVGLLVVGVGAPPSAGAARDGGDGAPVEAPPARGLTSEVMDVRVLLYDLLNQADPEQWYVAFLDLIFYVEPTGPIPKMIESMQTDEEGRGAVVDDLFGAVLRRAADPASRTFFIGRLARTGRQKVMADLLASAEYHARRGGGTDAGWIDALYRDALGRPADAAGRQYFLDQMAAGRTRGSIASFFTGGAEGRRALVRRLMTELLRRPADAAGVTYFASRLAAGTSVERVIAMIASSDEYAITSRAPQPLPVDVVLLLPDDRIEYRQLGDLVGLQPRTIAVDGLPDGDHLVAIGIRPVTESLYGITDGGQVMALTPGGDATLVGSPLPGFDATGGVGLDVDPVDDVIEVVAGDRVHRVDPDTGATTTTASLAYAAGDRHQGTTPDLAAGAFTNRTTGLPLPTETTRYAIDAAADALVTRTPGGTLTTVGPLHADVGTVIGLDTSPDAPQAAYAVFDLPEAGTSFWRIDLATGQPRVVALDHADELLDLAVVGDPKMPGDEPAYGVTPGATPQLRRFTTRDGEATQSWSVVGVAPGTDVVGLDVRPATGGLYGIGSNGQVYGLALGPGPTTVTATAIGSPLAGIDPADGIGFDVDPATDAIRVVDGDRSRAVRISDGVVLADEPVVFHLQPGGPAIVGSAFTSSERGAPAPPADREQAGHGALFHLELAEGGRLLWEQPLYENEVTDVGALVPGGGFVVSGIVGFDISGGLRHTPYALLEVGGRQTVASIDLATGEASPLTDVSETPQTAYSAFALA